MVNQDIRGTYQLVRRELPDGTTQYPPTLKGLLTLDAGFRNFSVVWTDDGGKFYSESYVARYTLTDEQYAETQEFLIVNDEIGGKGISYDLSNNTARSPVFVEGDRIRFDFPQPFEKALSITAEFDRKGLTATGKDQFVDYWERVS